MVTGNQSETEILVTSGNRNHPETKIMVTSGNGANSQITIIAYFHFY